MTGSPIALNIPVTPGAPSSWIAEVRAYLETHAAAAAVRDIWEILPANGNFLELRRQAPAGNDLTSNIALATGTATGITAAPNSTITVAGVAGYENDGRFVHREGGFEQLLGSPSPIRRGEGLVAVGRDVGFPHERIVESERGDRGSPNFTLRKPASEEQAAAGGTCRASPPIPAPSSSGRSSRPAALLPVPVSPKR